jgi:RNA polymerase sigma factor (TIGR02999 family)
MSRSAAEQIFAAAYDELHVAAKRQMAREKVAHTLQPTALLNEVYLKLFGPERADWEGHAQFLAIAVRAMRQLLVDHARKRGAEKRGGRWDRVSLSDIGGLTGSGMIDSLELEDALSKLAERSERMARVLELRVFAGLTAEEIGALLGVTRKTVQQDWRVGLMWMRAYLAGEEGI